MTTFRDRLQSALQRSGRSNRNVSLGAGLNAGTVTDILANPDRSPSIDNVIAIARELGTSAAWLITGEGTNEPPGFSDSDVAVWTPQKPGGQRPDLIDTTQKLVRTLAPEARSPSSFRLSRDIPGLNLEADDILNIDSKRPAQNGEMVVATVVDLGSGSGNTVVRLLLSPYLVEPDKSRGEVLLNDGARTVIMGEHREGRQHPQAPEQLQDRIHLSTSNHGLKPCTRHRLRARVLTGDGFFVDKPPLFPALTVKTAKQEIAMATTPLNTFLEGLCDAGIDEICAALKAAAARGDGQSRSSCSTSPHGAPPNAKPPATGARPLSWSPFRRWRHERRNVGSMD